MKYVRTLCIIILKIAVLNVFSNVKVVGAFFVVAFLKTKCYMLKHRKTLSVIFDLRPITTPRL